MGRESYERPAPLPPPVGARAGVCCCCVCITSRCGLRSEVVEVDLGGKALCLDPSLPNIQRVSELLRSVEAQNPAYQWVGASVPVVPLLAEVAGAEPILVGYGLEEDLMHAPNESFSLAQFERGFMFCGMFFSTT